MPVLEQLGRTADGKAAEGVVGKDLKPLVELFSLEGGGEEAAGGDEKAGGAHDVKRGGGLGKSRPR